MKIMKGYFELFGKQIPYYGILFFIGLFLGAILAVLRSKKNQLQKDDLLYASIFAGIGGVAGAKILSILTSIPLIIEYQLGFEDIIKNGFVFYGGLLGGMLGLWIYVAVYKCPKLAFFDCFAVSVPIGHAFGRVGCFLSGCCYGMPHTGFLSFTYHESLNSSTPLGVPLLPIQLIECFVLIMIYIILVILYYKVRKKGVTLICYLYLYPLSRFILEFFRGDVERGSFLFLSTSQWISLGLLTSAIILTIWYCKHAHTKA